VRMYVCMYVCMYVVILIIIIIIIIMITYVGMSWVVQRLGIIIRLDLFVAYIRTYLPTLPFPDVSHRISLVSLCVYVVVSHSNIYTYMYIHTCTYIHVHTYMYIHTSTYTYIHAYNKSSWYILLLLLLRVR